eukprot:762622-Amphidinium_carterae.4
MSFSKGYVDLSRLCSVSKPQVTIEVTSPHGCGYLGHWRVFTLGKPVGPTTASARFSKPSSAPIASRTAETVKALRAYQ